MQPWAVTFGRCAGPHRERGLESVDDGDGHGTGTESVTEEHKLLDERDGVGTGCGLAETERTAPRGRPLTVMCSRAPQSRILACAALGEEEVQRARCCPPGKGDHGESYSDAGGRDVHELITEAEDERSGSR